MLGFISPPVFRSYRQLPDYAAALLAAGFAKERLGKILGGNYMRVFEIALA
jgi:membrane dipeptidase